MASYLVTGIAGFIGSAVARALLAQGHRVVGVDNLTTGYRENIPDGAEFYEAACQDARLYAELLPREPYAAIFHIAGQSSGEISFDDPVYDLRTNTESTLHLLKFALAVGCERMMYASSMSVYGDRPDEPVKESAPACPRSFYGVGKLASEHYLRLYEQYGVRSTALRLFNVYGPGQNMSNMRQGMVSIYMAMMLDKGDIHVKGGPDRYRDFVYIDDVVRAFLLCLDHPESSGRVINIGGSGRVTVGELVEALKKLHNAPCSVRYAGGTPGDMHGIHADMSLAAEVLGYAPRTTLPEGLKRMYDWATGGRSAK